MKKNVKRILFLAVLPCCGGNQASSDIEALKNNILGKPCDPAVIEELRYEIERQSKSLTPEQFKKSLQNMIEDTKC